MDISRSDFLKGIVAGALGTLSTIAGPLAYAEGTAEVSGSPLATRDNGARTCSDAVKSAISAIKEMPYTLKSSQLIFELGSLTGTSAPYTENAGDSRIRSKNIFIDKATTITCATGYSVALCGNVDYKSWTQNLHVYNPQVARLLIKKNNNSGFTDSDLQNVSSMFTVTTDDEFCLDYKSEIETVKGEISNSYENMSVSYGFITDIHDQGAPSKRQISALAKIATEADVDLLICGGDLINGNLSTKEIALGLLRNMTEDFAKSRKPVLIAKGNHDYNSIDGHTDAKIITYNEWYGNMIGTFGYTGVHDSTNTSSTYWYYDLDTKKTRVIILDTSDWVDDYDTSAPSYHGIGDAQIAWLVNEALTKTESGWRYVFIGHEPLLMEYTCWNTIPVNSAVVVGLMKALNGKTSYSGTTASGATVTKDFSSFNSKVVLYHFGHVHADMMANDDRIMWMSTRCAYRYGSQQSAEALHITYEGYTLPEGGTAEELSEAAFDVVRVTNTGVTAYRFGNGSNRTLNFS